MKTLHQNLMLILLFFLGAIPVLGQQSIVFTPKYDEANLELNRSYYLPNEIDFFELSTLKFYISDIAFLNENKIVYTLPKKHFLLDLENQNSLTLPFKLDNSIIYTSIKFKLGIDSLTNVSGALGGDLDPTNGMYWTWQSGYINFKMEGTSPYCPARKNKFQFHLGGYLSPYYGMREIEIQTTNQEDLHIEFDLQKFFNSIDLSETYQIMSPNAEAMKLTSRLITLFRIK